MSQQQISPPLDLVIEVWKKVVDVQMHFNDIEMRIRNLSATVLAAIVASIGFVLEKEMRIEFDGISFSVALVLLVAGFVAMYLFYFMDRHWYHRLLLGSVKEGLQLEQYICASTNSDGLTKHIGDESPLPVGRWDASVYRLFVGGDRLQNERRLHSNEKIDFFYKLPMSILLCSIIFFEIFLVRINGENMWDKVF